jgi:hypothetical protein
MSFEPISRSADMRFLARALCGLIAAVAVASGFVRTLPAQTLADIAKQEEERRKDLKNHSKIITNKDLRGQVVGPPPVAAGQTAGADDSKEPATDSSKDAAKDGSKDAAKDGSKEGAKDAANAEGAKGESYWRERMKTLQTALDRDQTHLDALQSRINALTTEFVNRDDPAQRSRIEGDRQKSLAELDRLKKQVEDDKKAIAAAQTEGRRAGAHADWLR